MILDYLRDVAVPIIVAFLGLGIWGARRVSRATESPAASPLPSPPPPGARPQTEVEAWLFEQMKVIIPEHAEMKERLTALEDAAPLVQWVVGNQPPPPPRPSDRLLRAFGLAHLDEELP